MKVVVLGAGLVGGAIAKDLAKDGEFEVTVVDMAEGALAHLGGVSGVETRRADLADSEALRKAIEGQDLAVGAVPGSMGFATLRTVLGCGRPVVDISFFPEDALSLDALACEHGVCAVVDCGIAPGCSNLILGRMEREFDALEAFTCYVGGLPAVRTWPWEYKAPFSPSDVLEEYTRPARYVAGGRLVTMPALSEAELVEFPGVGTLEAFNTDGLRSLLATVKVPFMVEKTMRYPGHAERIRMLRESGFFATELLEVGGAQVRPLDLTSRLLFPLVAARRGRGGFYGHAGDRRGWRGWQTHAAELRAARPLRPGERDHLHGPHDRVHVHRGRAAALAGALPAARGSRRPSSSAANPAATSS